MKSARCKAILNEARQQLQTARGRHASLEALQHAALGQEESAASGWLDRLGLANARRLGESLNVDAGFEAAAETVLAGLLDGVLVDDPLALATELGELTDADIALIASATGGDGPAGTLAAHVRGPASITHMLSRIRVADSIDQARHMAGSLAAGESVITRDGAWMGPGFARVRRAQGNQVGVLARERDMRQLAAQLETLEAQGEEGTERLEALRTSKFETERARDDAQRDLYAAHRRLSELAGQLQSHRGKMETARARSEKVGAELSTVLEQLEEMEGQAREARARLDESVGNMGDMEDQRRALENERRELLEAREEARINAREAAEQSHQLALGMESKRSALTRP